MSRVRALGRLVRAVANAAQSSAVRNTVRRARPANTITRATKSVAQRTRASSSPGIAKRITKAQAAANAAKAAKRNPPTPTSRATTSGPIPRGNVAAQARGSRFPGSSGTKIAPDNSYKTTGNPSNRELTRSNKRAAATEYSERVGSSGSRSSTTVRGRYTRLNEQGAKPRNDRGWNEQTKNIARQERDRNRLNAFMPDGGRVSPSGPSKRGIALQKAETASNRTAARSAARADVSAAKAAAKAKAEAYQRSNTVKDLKGTTAASRKAMSESVTNSPRTKPIKATSTTTTGTRRIAANPTSGTSSTKTPDGEIRKAFGRGVRTVDPNTGRPYRLDASGQAVTNKPSPNRTRGANPADSRPKASPAPAKGSVQEANARRAKDIKAAGAREGRQLRLKSEGDYTGPGLNVRNFKPGNTSGIRPTDSRGSSTPLRRQGSATQDQRQLVNGKPIGRLGQPGQSNVRNPEVDRRAAITKAAEKLLGKQPTKPTPTPTRSPQRASALSARSKASSGDMRDVRNMTPDELKTLRNKWEDRLGQPATGTLRGGEVRLDGSARGGDFVTGINSTNVGPRAPHSGKPSRVVGKVKNESRSVEATNAANKTIENLRAKKALRKLLIQSN